MKEPKSTPMLFKRIKENAYCVLFDEIAQKIEDMEALEQYSLYISNYPSLSLLRAAKELEAYGYNAEVDMDNNAGVGLIITWEPIGVGA